jgi:hypothetical protein
MHQHVRPLNMAMCKYSPGITTSYSYPRYKNNFTESLIYTDGYRFTSIPILMWI